MDAVNEMDFPAFETLIVSLFAAYEAVRLVGLGGNMPSSFA